MPAVTAEIGPQWLRGDCRGRFWQDKCSRACEIPFTYRRSGLDGWVVLETTVRLQQQGRPISTQRSRRCSNGASGVRLSISRAAAACSRTRLVQAGSKRMARVPPGQLIEAAGLKGFSVGGAQVSPMHANYFVNTGSGTAADVKPAHRARAGGGAGKVWSRARA